MKNNVTVGIMENNSGALERLRKGLKEALKKRLARARDDLGYSPADVLGEFKRNGIERTPGSLSQMEHGSRLPSVEALYVLAKYLNTSTDYLLGLTDNSLSVRDIEEELAIAKGGGAADRIISRLTREQRQQVLTFAEFLLAQDGHAQAIASKNEAGWEAAMNVFTNKHGEIIAEDLLHTLHDNFPALAQIVGPITPGKNRRINKG